MERTFIWWTLRNYSVSFYFLAFPLLKSVFGCTEQRLKEACAPRWAGGRILAHAVWVFTMDFWCHLVVWGLIWFCGLSMCGSLPCCFVFFFKRSNRAFPKPRGLAVGVFFLWYFFICFTHCAGSKVHEVMTLQNAKRWHLLLNSLRVHISQQSSAPHAAEGSGTWWQSNLIQTYPPNTEVAFRVQRGQKLRMKALVLGLLNIILCYWCQWEKGYASSVRLCLWETEVASCSACPRFAVLLLECVQGLIRVDKICLIALRVA